LQMVYKTGSNQNDLDDDEGGDGDEEEDTEIWFRGSWSRTGAGGRINMKLTNKTVVLEHAIKPGKYLFFGLSSWRRGHVDVNRTYTKIEAEFLDHGLVGGSIHLFGANWMEQYEDEEVAEGVVPENEFAAESHGIVDGEWHHFGKIVFVLDDQRETSGFFSGSFFIGEWHPNSAQYLTKKVGNGMALKRTSSVLSMHSVDEEVDDEVTASNEMKRFHEERARNRIGHFELTLIEQPDIDIEDGTDSKLNLNAKKGMESVDDDDDEMMLHRHRSLDSDDESEDAMDVMSSNE